MATLVLFLVFAGFFFLYNTSKRATTPRALPVEKWMYNSPQIARPMGGGLLCLALAMSAWVWGLGSGILLFTIILMTLGSLIIILSPLRVLNYKALSSILILSLIFETVL